MSPQNQMTQRPRPMHPTRPTHAPVTQQVTTYPILPHKPTEPQGTPQSSQQQTPSMPSNQRPTPAPNQHPSQQGYLAVFLFSAFLPHAVINIICVMIYLQVLAGSISIAWPYAANATNSSAYTAPKTYAATRTTAARIRRLRWIITNNETITR